MTTKKGIIFDMDGVLVDAMPFHAEAMSRAIKEITNHEIDKKNIFLLEGMPSSDLVKEIFKRENINKKIDVDDDDDLQSRSDRERNRFSNRFKMLKG